MAPIVLKLSNFNCFNVKVLLTAQHREILDQMLRDFGITRDIDFDLMKERQSLSGIAAQIIERFDRFLVSENPDLVLGQGDTTTVMAVSLACFHRKIDFGHVEAGLRTGDLDNPFPEEANRIIAGKLSKFHFAPTESARRNLLSEGISEKDIYVTGNTVIDSLLMTAAGNSEIGIEIDPMKRLILVTSHRRENFGQPLRNICHGLQKLSLAYPDVMFLYPVHPNPNVREIVYELLEGHENIILTSPLSYDAFVAAMKRAYLVISDSGGVQEEAPALGKPVLVLREETERPEAVDLGVVKLVGPDSDRIFHEAQVLLDDKAAYSNMARGVSPYGDGRASERIVQVLRERLF
jgi:UDP-N-acetylglucosamine 2-epimerase (non-hydrolysing)